MNPDHVVLGFCEDLTWQDMLYPLADQVQVRASGGLIGLAGKQ